MNLNLAQIWMGVGGVGGGEDLSLVYQADLKFLILCLSKRTKHAHLNADINVGNGNNRKEQV